MSPISDDGNRPNQHENDNNKEKDMKIWGVHLFGLIGATVTTAQLNHFSQVRQLRNAVDFVKSQGATLLQKLFRQSPWKGTGWGSSQTGFQEEARRRFYRRIQEEYEEEMERLERMRRMQTAFNRERNKHKRSYDRWSDQGSGVYHQDFQRDDWYVHGESSYKNQGTYEWTWYWHGDSSFKGSGPYGGANDDRETPQTKGSHSLSHHYSVLGLDRTRTKPYTDNEIKSAFRAKAMKFHPDQNQDNKEVAEAKFKEVMTSYEAIKRERKNK